MAAPVHTIDKLPEVERKKVLDAILAGETLSSVAAKLGITRQAMSSYNNRVIKPAMRTAAELADVRRRNREDAGMPANVSRETSPVGSQKDHAIATFAENKALTREVLKASPLMERHEFLWQSAQKGIRAAQDAVRVTYDEEGNEVSVAQDLSALAPLLNQGHKNVEILGKLTGELKDANDVTSININIVLPAASPAPRADYANAAGDCYEMGDK